MKLHKNPLPPQARKLQDAVNKAITHSLATPSEGAYNKYWAEFQSFASNMLNEQPLPSSRHVIPLFIMYLHEKNLQVSSIRNYLSAIAFTHKIHDYGIPQSHSKLLNY